MNRTQHVATGIKSLKGNEILAMIQQTQEGTMVAIRPLCAALKLEWARQAEKLASNPRFDCVHMYMVGADGKHREMICLPAEQVPDWINSINANKVPEEKRKALLELHKFFGYALNEFSRERFVTKAEMDLVTEEIRKQLIAALELVQKLVEENKALKETNESLWKARNFEASSASYGMHSAKARKKAVFPS